VDGKTGQDTNSGRSESDAFKTIAKYLGRRRGAACPRWQACGR